MSLRWNFVTDCPMQSSNCFRLYVFLAVSCIRGVRALYIVVTDFARESTYQSVSIYTVADLVLKSLQ